MNGAAGDGERRFLHRFGEARMAVAASGHILRGAAEFHCHHQLLDEVPGLRSDDVGTQDPVRPGVGEDFDEAVGIGVAPGAGIGG